MVIFVVINLNHNCNSFIIYIGQLFFQCVYNFTNYSTLISLTCYIAHKATFKHIIKSDKKAEGFRASCSDMKGVTINS